MQYTLYHGKCENVLPTLADNSVDAIITDPPYNTTVLKWEQPIDWAAFWQEAHRVCKPHAVIVLFSQQPFTTDLINSNRQYFRYEIIWQKTRALGFFSANQRPLRAHENILIFARKCRESTYNPQKTKGEPYYHPIRKSSVHYGNDRLAETVSDGARYPHSVLQIPNPNNNLVHPTQKPLPLIQWLVRTYSNPGDTILDCFMGSGTTGEACIIEGRNFIGIEQDEGYYTIARARIEAAAQAQQLELGAS